MDQALTVWVRHQPQARADVPGVLASHALAPRPGPAEVMAVPAVQQRYVRRISQASHNYRGGPLSPRNAGRGLAPGDRLPVVSGLLGDAQSCSTLDLLASPLHTLLVLPGDPPDTASAQAAIARLNRWDHIVHTIRIDDRGGVGDPGSRAHRRYHALAGRLLLVRTRARPAEGADPVPRHLA